MRKRHSVLSAENVHLSEAGQRRNGNQQQDSGCFHRPKKQCPCPQWHIRGEPQASKQRFFLAENVIKHD